MRPAVPSERSVMTASGGRVAAGHEVVVVVEVIDAWPNTVLQPSIRLTAEFHPVIDRLLDGHGFSGDGMSRSTTRAGSVKALADLVHPSRVWPDGRSVRLENQVASRKRKIRSMCGTSPAAKAMWSYAGSLCEGTGSSAVLVSVSGGTVRIRPYVQELGTLGERRVHFEEFEELCEEFSRQQISVIERGNGGGVAALRLWGDGLVVVRHGAVLHEVEVTEFSGGAFTRKTCPIGDALEDSHRWFDAGLEVVAAESLLGLADIADATGTGREGLTGEQDEFCSKYAVADRGMVCALPPGGGKTVVAVRCLAERRDRERRGGRRSRAVCVVPGVVLGQWREAFARWAADLPVAESYSAWKQASGVLLVSHGEVRDLAECLESDGLLVDDLVVDEAHIACHGALGEHLRKVRHRTRRALALTGTVEGRRGRRGASEVLATVTGTEDLEAFDAMQVRGGLGGLYPMVYRGGEAVRWPRPVSPAWIGQNVDESVRAAARDVDVALAALQGMSSGTSSARAFSRDGARARRHAAAGRAAVRRSVESFVAAANRAAEDSLVAAAAALEGPAIVFCEEEEVRTALSERWDGCVVLDGRVRPEARAAAAARFQSGEVERMVLTRTSSLGLNLQRAATVMFADHVATSDQIRQRIGRAARLGHDGSALIVVSGEGPGRTSRRAVEAVLRGESFDEVWFAGMISRWSSAQSDAHR